MSEFTQMDQTVQIELVKAAMMQDVFQTNELFIDMVERFLHYVALTIVTGSENDQERIRIAIEIAHDRLDEIVAKTAASARKHEEEHKHGPA